MEFADGKSIIKLSTALSFKFLNRKGDLSQVGLKVLHSLTSKNINNGLEICFFPTFWQHWLYVVLVSDGLRSVHLNGKS